MTVPPPRQQDVEAKARGRRLAVASAAACVLGCALAQPDGLPPASPGALPGPSTARWAALALAVTAWASAGRAARRGRARGLLAAACILTGAFLLGTARAPRPAPPEAPARRPVALLARVVRVAPDATGWFLVDRLRAPDGRALDRPGRRLLVLPFDGNPPRPGSPVHLQGLLRREDARSLLEGATWSPAPGPPRAPWRERVRGRLHAVLAPPDAALAAALLLGDSGAAPEDLQASYRDLGLLHLLCVSGMHVWCWAALLRRLLPGRAAPLRMPAMAAVVALAGAAAPVVRAASALLLRDVAARRGWSVAPLRLWAAALWMELLLAPARVSGLGFVLSYAATFHLLLVLDACRGRAEWVRLGAVSCAATLGTLPWLLRAAATVQPWAPLLSPLFALLLPPRILLSAAALLPGAGGAAGALLGALRGLEDLALAPLRRMPGAPLACTVLPWAAALGFAVSATLALRMLLAGRRRAAASAAALAGALLAVRAPAPPAVVALPVGHGLAVVVGGAAGSVLFDLGSADLAPDRLVGRVLLPELRRRGWPLPRTAVLSHADHDHGNGIPALAPYRRPRMPEAAAGESRSLPAPAPWRLTLHGLVPELRGAPNGEGQALEVEARGFRAVLLGDPWGHALLDLRRRLRPGPVDLLLLPHHGRTTEGVAELVEHLRPRRLWIASEEDAEPAVLELLLPRDGRVERTGPGVLEARPPAPARAGARAQDLESRAPWGGTPSPLHGGQATARRGARRDAARRTRAPGARGDAARARTAAHHPGRDAGPGRARGARAAARGAAGARPALPRREAALQPGARAAAQDRHAAGRRAGHRPAGRGPPGPGAARRPAAARGAGPDGTAHPACARHAAGRDGRLALRGLPRRHHRAGGRRRGRARAGHPRLGATRPRGGRRVAARTRGFLSRLAAGRAGARATATAAGRGARPSGGASRRAAVRGRPPPAVAAGASRDRQEPAGATGGVPARAAAAAAPAGARADRGGAWPPARAA